jgi:restriction system protein
MGYAGAAGSAEHTGRPGDRGLDGVISQDALGLDRIYVQAKRFAKETPVRRPEIQEFVGALHGAQVDRGIFVTTSLPAIPGKSPCSITESPQLMSLGVSSVTSAD